jgi:hypothetical protein
LRLERLDVRERSRAHLRRHHAAQVLLHVHDVDHRDTGSARPKAELATHGLAAHVHRLQVEGNQPQGLCAQRRTLLPHHDQASPVREGQPLLVHEAGLHESLGRTLVALALPGQRHDAGKLAPLTLDAGLEPRRDQSSQERPRVVRVPERPDLDGGSSRHKPH